MEGVIFWLAPVLLLIVFSLLLLRHQRDYVRPHLTLVEPASYLVKKWRLVRTIGNDRALREWLARIQSTNSQAQNLLELISGQTELIERPQTATLVRANRLGLWGEERLVEIDSRLGAVIFGSPDEVLPLVKTVADGKTTLSAEAKSEARRTAATAGRHGYLAIAAGVKAVHGRVMTDHKNYNYLGLILLEPILDESRVESLRRLKSLRLFSPISTGLLEWFWQKIRQTDQPLNRDKPASNQPGEREKYWDSSPVIGDADLNERHVAVRYFQHRYHCRLLSNLEEDKRLPLADQPRQ